MRKTEIPSIRFRGFDDAWEQRKLGDIIIEYKETVDSDCTLPILTSSKTEGVILQEEHFGRKQQHDITGYNILPRNYCTYRNRSDGVDFTFNINKCCDKGIISKFYPVFSGKNCDVFFLSLVLNNSDEVVREIAYTCTGTGQKVLSFWNLQKMKVRAPSFDEQKEIAAYFEDLDHLITLHQRKFEKLTNVKKSMLEKMFPRNGSCYPEIRFKGFTDPWEQRKLGEVATFINGRAYSQPELLSSGKYKVLRVGNFYTNDSWYYSDLELGEKYYADYGDLLYTWSATFGPHIWLGDRVIYHYHIWKINLSDQLEKQFAVQLLEQDRANILSSKNGSTMVHITKEGMEQKDVIIPPSTKEQQEIGAFFLQLDNLITLHQHELEKLQSIKKALLEKMFV